jgi:hypothetical protein
VPSRYRPSCLVAAGVLKRLRPGPHTLDGGNLGQDAAGDVGLRLDGAEQVAAWGHTWGMHQRTLADNPGLPRNPRLADPPARTPSACSHTGGMASMACKGSGVQIPSAPPQVNGHVRARPSPNRSPRAADRQQSTLPDLVRPPRVRTTPRRSPVPSPHGALPRRTTASLGSTLGPLRMGWSYSSVGMGSVRGCPWMTAADRCVGRVGGRSGEDDVARSLLRRSPAGSEGEACPR